MIFQDLEGMTKAKLRLTRTRCNGCERGGVMPRGPSYAKVSDLIFQHQFGIIKIAAIEHDGIAHGGSEALEIQTAKLRPIGEDQKCVDILGCVIGVDRILEVWTRWEDLLCTLHCCGIEGSDGASFLHQHSD